MPVLASKAIFLRLDGEARQLKINLIFSHMRIRKRPIIAASEVLREVQNCYCALRATRLS